MAALYLISLGCAKNQVDTEMMLGLLLPRGCALCGRPEEADVLLVNTCAFIEPAREESIDAILELAHNKNDGQKLIVCGCLPERYSSELRSEIPEVDEWLNIKDERRVFEIIAGWFPGCVASSPPAPRIRISPGHYAYLRVADGCDHVCSFCAIPAIRGQYRSLPVDEILREAQRLADEGVVELNLIAQDTSSYARDLTTKTAAADLLRRLCHVEGIRWIRLQYLYPASVTNELLDVIAAEEKVCKYIDIPLQHISDKVLRHMRRPGRESVVRLVDTIHDRVPGAVLRTSLIVGYPVEGEREFDELREFVASARFHHLGVFEYSREEGTEAYAAGDPVPSDEKKRRARVIMELQQGISHEWNLSRVGSKLPVLIDDVDADGVARGRTRGDAPEVDGLVHIDNAEALEPGDIVPVNVTRAEPYDIFGVCKQ